MERYPLLLLCLPILAMACAGGPDDDDDTVGEETLVILTGSLPDGRVGVQYGATLEAETVVGVDWSLDAGSLPPGIDLAADGTLGGTPAVSGDFSFTVAANDGKLYRCRTPCSDLYCQ